MRKIWQKLYTNGIVQILQRFSLIDFLFLLLNIATSIIEVLFQWINNEIEKYDQRMRLSWILFCSGTFNSLNSQRISSFYSRICFAIFSTRVYVCVCMLCLHVWICVCLYVCIKTYSSWNTYTISVLYSKFYVAEYSAFVYVCMCLHTLMCVYICVRMYILKF